MLWAAWRKGRRTFPFNPCPPSCCKFIQIVKSDPAVAHLVVLPAAAAAAPTDQGRMFVTLKPLGERTNTADEVVARLRAECARVPGATCIFSANQDLRIGGRMSSAQYQYTIKATPPGPCQMGADPCWRT
jgi:multidrug efflux pump subunit AcrB